MKTPKLQANPKTPTRKRSPHRKIRHDDLDLIRWFDDPTHIDEEFWARLQQFDRRTKT